MARDYATGDGAYVLVGENRGPLERAVARKIFAGDGKYAAYGAPADVALRATDARGAGDAVFECGARVVYRCGMAGRLLLLPPRARDATPRAASIRLAPRGVAADPPRGRASAGGGGVAR